MATFRPEYCHTALQICQMGGTDLQLASALNASLTEIKRWQSKYPQFGEACRVGGEAAVARVVWSLYERATGYNHDAVRHDKVKKEGVDEIIVTEYVNHIPPDVGAIKYFLDNMDPENWSSTIKKELTGKDGAPLVPEGVTELVLEDMSDEELEVLGSYVKRKATDG